MLIGCLVGCFGKHSHDDIGLLCDNISRDPSVINFTGLKKQGTGHLFCTFSPAMRIYDLEFKGKSSYKISLFFSQI